MKQPTKTLLSSTGMFAFIVGLVLAVGCQKDVSSLSDSSDSDSLSTERRRWGGWNGGGGSSNQLPEVRPGADQTITLPTNSVELDGSHSFDNDGSIATYKWTKDFGPGGTIVSPSSAKTTAKDLTAGIYRFKLTVTDNSGGSASDTVRITVNGTGGGTTTNQPPTVNAGSNQTITLPVSTVTLSGSATDADGSIASYLWTKVSGSGGVITAPATPVTTVTSLTAGSYVFNLRATDNSGASANKTVSVTVNPATTTPPPPPPPAGYTLTFQSGYDQMSDITTNNGQYGNGTISTTTYVTGPGSFYSRPQNVSNGIRSEVQYTGSAQNPVEGAIEYDVKYEVLIPNNGCSIQWHPYTPGSSGSPFLLHENGKFVWMNWINGGNQRHNTNFTIQTGRWYHMRIEHKFGSNGYWRHYIDGVLVCSWTGQVGDGSGQYLKVGYNGWDANSANSRIYYDNLKIWRKN